VAVSGWRSRVFMSMSDGWRRRWSRRVAMVLPAVLVVTLADVPVWSEPAVAAPAAPAAKPQCPGERQDAVSAVVTAKLCGKRVEVMDRRSETSQLWALPTGGFSQEMFAAPVRFQRADAWVDIDVTLQKAPDGSVAPVAHPNGMRFSGEKKDEGTHELARATVDGETVSLSWSGKLPEPTLSGGRATYSEAQAGVDVVVEATPRGFEQFLVVKDRVAAARVATLRMPLKTGKLRLVNDAPGAFAMQNGSGVTVGRMPTPKAWDAAAQTPGAPRAEVALGVATRARGSVRRRDATGTPPRPAAPGARGSSRAAVAALGAGAVDAAEGTGEVELELSADPAWLNDAARTYPVTLDPEVTFVPAKDVYVRSDLSADHSGDDRLEMGYGKNKVTGTESVARTLMAWDTGFLPGAQVASANLYLHNFWSGVCGQRWDLHKVAAFTAPVTWETTKDGWGKLMSSSTETGGAAGCADGYVMVEAKSLFQEAADEGLTTTHLGLKAFDETNSASHKDFWSSERGRLVTPKLVIAYETAPLLSDPQIQPSSGGCGVGEAKAYVTSLTPQLRATLVKQDATATSVTFQWSVVGGAKIGSTTVADVPSGTVASAGIPAGALVEGGTYSWEAQASGTRSSLLKRCEFTVDTVKPKVPFVASSVYPSTATSNTWGRGGAGQAADFTFTPATGDTDVVAYVYQQDLDAAATTVTATGQPWTVSVTPKEDGRRTLTVRSKDRAGNLSEPATYQFNVGRAGLKLPAAGANVVKRMKLAIDGDSTYTKARFRYRRGPGGMEHDVPLANLHKGNGDRATTYPLPVSDLQPYAVWNAMDTLGEVGGVVQVSAKLFTSTDPVDAPGYQTQWTTVTVDSNGDGAAASDLGPASVNLLTGDATVSSTDVSEFGLSVGRVASSREPADGWTPQGERVSPATQQVTDLAEFSGETTATLARVTDRGQGSSTDALQITPGWENTDTFAAVGGDWGGLRLGMRPGKRYRATGWIYVPAATGLTGGHNERALRIAGFALNAAGTVHEVRSPKATWTEGWQELTVDLVVPAGATMAFFRLYNGMPGSTGKKVYWDNISVREVVAPFGPQWRGGAADSVGGSDYTTLEFPSTDLVKINTTDGDWLTFARNTAGQFFGEPGAEDVTLTKINDTTYRLSDLNGTVTEFGQQGSGFVVTTTWTADSASTSRYLYDSRDYRTLVRRVINPVEPGVGDCTTDIPARGCEVLEYDYSTSTTATSGTPGDVVDQIRSVKVWSWDPGANNGGGAQTAAEVARYLYDDQGGLREVGDPRLAQPLKTVYGYDGQGRVNSITPAGQLPWTLVYGFTPGADTNQGRLMRVRRAALKTGTKDQLDGEIATTVVYGVPLTKVTGGPEDLDAAAIRRWGQQSLPTDGTAIFGPEADPGTSAANATKPGTRGYIHATVHYMDASGQEINTLTPGGHFDSSEYDQYGNVVRALEATNRELALGTLPDAASKAADLGLPDDSAMRADLLATYNTYSADGLDLVATLGPSVKVALERDLSAPGKPTLLAGTQVVARHRTTYRYDEGKPDGTAYHLRTTETSGAAVAGYPDADVRTTRTGYNAEKGGTSGWKLKKETSVTTAAGVNHLVYDSAGRTVKASGIGSNGADAMATTSVFYTASANADDPACENKPEWAGQPCTTRAAGPAAGHRADMAASLPVKRVDSYTRFGEASVVSETSNGKVRRTLTTYDVADRPTSIQVTSDEGVPLPATIIEYDVTSGLSTATRTGVAKISREYDRLGRILAYTDADGGVTRNEFDRFGKQTRVTDPTGSQLFEYDRTAEPRGLLTSVTDSVAGRFSGKYSADGKLVEVRYPGGITRTDTLDASMTPVARQYKRDSDGAAIHTESIVENSQGQWINHNYTGGSKTFGYDVLGRLTTVKQLDSGASCVTRAYAYDNRTNRTGKKTFSGATCDSNGALEAEEAHTYDTADRLTDRGYSYDDFGRTTATPAGLTNTFYANDLVASQQFGDTRQQWTVDPAQRLRGYTTQKVINNVWSNASSKINHYGDDSDEPRWTVEDVKAGTVTRNVSGLDTDLVATTSQTGDVRLQLTNLHGDVAATIDPTMTAPQFYSFDEFGVSAARQTDPRYGWLGGKQRSAEALGDVILMGVRLYSPGIGRFLQVDPEPGGSATSYDYCSADPINCFDLDGKWPSFKRMFNYVKNNAGNIGTGLGIAATVLAFIPGAQPFAAVLGAVATGFSLWGAYNDARSGNWGSAGISAATSVPGVGGVARSVRLLQAARTLRKAKNMRRAYQSGKNSSSLKRQLNRSLKKADRARKDARRALRGDARSVGVTLVDSAKTGCGLRSRCRNRKMARKDGSWWVGTGYARY